MERGEVFRLIDKERKYQDEKWGVEFDKSNELGEWLVYIEEYLKRAKKKLLGSHWPGGLDIEPTMYIGDPALAHKLHRTAVKKDILKIITLGVACFEYLLEDGEFDEKVGKICEIE